MTCDDLVRLLSEYIDNNLNEGQLHAAMEHLATCSNCHLVLDTTQKTILLCKNNQSIAISLDLNQKLFTRLKPILKNARL
jgi:anti-sigma factor RsiW